MACSSARSGCSPGRTRAIGHRSLPGSTPAASAGEQARPQRGGLAAARRPHDARQRRTGEPRDHLGDEPLAAEEELGVLHVERGQALERADHGTVVRKPAGLRALPPRVQLDDAAHQVVLGRAQRRALGREAGRGVPQAPDGHLARLLARHAMQLLRHAAAHLRQPFDEDLDVLASSRSSARQLARRVGVERRQGQRRGGRSPGTRSMSSAVATTSTGSALRPSTSSRRAACHLRADAVGVVEHQQRRPLRDRRPRPRRAPPRASPSPDAYRTAPPSRCTSAASSATRRVLPIPRAPATSTSRPAPRARPAPVLAQPVQLGLAPEQRRARVELGRRLGGSSRRRATGPGAGSPPATAADRGRARRRSARPAPSWPGGTPRARRPGCRSDTARASAAACSFSRSGSSSTSRSSSPTTSRCRPAARSRSIASSTAASRSSSSRRISAWANGTPATSASARRATAQAPRAPLRSRPRARRRRSGARTARHRRRPRRAAARSRARGSRSPPRRRPAACAAGRCSAGPSSARSRADARPTRPRRAGQTETLRFTSQRQHRQHRALLRRAKFDPAAVNGGLDRS